MTDTGLTGVGGYHTGFAIGVTDAIFTTANVADAGVFEADYVIGFDGLTFDS